MGLILYYLKGMKKFIDFRKYHHFNISKGNNCHYWELYLIPAISLFSCRSHFIEQEYKIHIKWLNYVLSFQIIFKRKENT